MNAKQFFTVLAAAVSTGAVAYGCSSSNSSTGGSDAGGSDATFDVVAHHDAASTGDDSSSTGDDSSASACPTPVDETNFTPPAYKHAKTALGACSASDISGFDTACLSSTATSTTCQTYQTAHATCASCLTSKSTDSTWGPLVVWNGVQSLNVAGCIELTNPSDTACPQVLESSDECTHAACDSVCPITDQTTFTAWQTCAQTADAQACGKYATPANNCYGGDDAAATNVCNLSNYNNSFEAAFVAVAQVFCGGGDAGTTPSDSGAADTGPSDAPPG
jgi:hypothetical protein